MCSELQSGLRNSLQDPLLVYTQWSHMVSQVLEASAEVTDFSHIAMIVQNIEVKHTDILQKYLNCLPNSCRKSPLKLELCPTSRSVTFTDTLQSNIFLSQSTVKISSGPLS